MSNTPSQSSGKNKVSKLVNAVGSLPWKSLLPRQHQLSNPLEATTSTYESQAPPGCPEYAQPQTTTQTRTPGSFDYKQQQAQTVMDPLPQQPRGSYAGYPGKQAGQATQRESYPGQLGRQQAGAPKLSKPAGDVLFQQYVAKRKAGVAMLEKLYSQTHSVEKYNEKQGHDHEKQPMDHQNGKPPQQSYGRPRMDIFISSFSLVFT